MINWQLSKQGIRWLVSPDHTAGSSVHPSRSSIFEVGLWQITNFKRSQAQIYFFLMIHIKYVIFMSLWPCTIRILISYRHRTRKFSQFFCKSTGGEDPFLPWSRVSLRSTSNFYALIGQNLTGEFMQKMYATSWKLFTLTAKADRVVMFITVFFLWMDKMSCCYQESSVIHGWFVYWVFGWEMGRLSKFGNSISDDIVFVFHLA